MEPRQSLFYALGEMAYAIASADGHIQREEKRLVYELLDSSFHNLEWDFDYAKIIFRILEKDKTDLETVYNWAIQEIAINRNHLTPVMKRKFIRALERVAEAFPPVTMKEQTLIARFINEINALPKKEIPGPILMSI